MLRRQQVFIRAKDPTGRYDTCDVLDLDDTSFRAFIVGTLWRHGLLVGIKDEYVKGDPIELRSTVPHRDDDDDSE